MKLQEFWLALKRFARSAVTHPREELTRWQRAVRFGYDLTRHGWRQLEEDRAPQMAAALAFRTLFALLPLLVVGTIVLRAFMGPGEFQDLISEFLALVASNLQLDDVQLVLSQAAGDQAQKSMTLDEWLRQFAQTIRGINLTAVGWVGLLVLIYAALGFMVTIENSFNTVYRAPTGRSWMRRLLIYWFVLTFGSLAIGLLVYMDNRFDAWASAQNSFVWLWNTLPVLFSFAGIWLLLFAIYASVPNTQVSLRTTAIGAFIAAIILAFITRVLGAYLENAVSLRQLYGQLGLIPLFMFWVYIMWLVILFGLELAATLQFLGGRSLETVQRPQREGALVDPAVVLAATSIVAEDFAHGRPTPIRGIAERLHLDEQTVGRIMDRLDVEGVVHHLARSDDSVTLARPPEQIPADKVLDVGYALAEPAPGAQAMAFLERLREVQRRLAADQTLAGLLAGAPGPTAAASVSAASETPRAGKSSG